MADYIFIRKSRNLISSLLHIILNLLLAVFSIGATVVTGNCVIGLILVVISKWRVFAVNHRYWLLNIRSSLVDFIVGVSLVLLAFAAGNTFLLIHFVLMAIYAIWLIVIKPRSTLNSAIAQSLIAVLLGSTTVTVFTAVARDNMMSVMLVALEFIIGYAASNHVLVQGSNDTADTALISLTAGLIFSEVAWLTHVWLIIYTLGNTGICVSQLAIILTIMAWTYFQVYLEISQHKGKLNLRKVALPLIFCVVVIAILLIGFSQPRFNI